MIKESELILNSDGSIFHLHLLPEQIADTVILVGDPGRVHMIAGLFDSIELTVSNREFTTLTGRYGDKGSQWFPPGLAPTTSTLS